MQTRHAFWFLVEALAHVRSSSTHRYQTCMYMARRRTMRASHPYQREAARRSGFGAGRGTGRGRLMLSGKATEQTKDRRREWKARWCVYGVMQIGKVSFQHWTRRGSFSLFGLLSRSLEMGW